MRHDVPLQSYNTLALESSASALVAVRSDEELREAFSWAAHRGLPLVVLGGGSNVVLAGDLKALVVLQRREGIEVIEERGDEVLLRVGAGENWHGLVEWALARGLYGLENLALIPGTVGAAPIQNIGAYGVELKSLVEMVHALRIADGQAVSMAGAECEFGYRDSVFKHRLRDKLVITAVELKLSRSMKLCVDYPALSSYFAGHSKDELTPRDVFDAVVDIRRSKLPDPSVVPNVGSFFKNPVLTDERAGALRRQFTGLPGYPLSDGMVKLPAAWLIDYCGWKGRSENGVGVHPEHALVLTNYGSNSGARLLQLAGDIVASVVDVFGIALEIEPRLYR